MHHLYTEQVQHTSSAWPPRPFACSEGTFLRYPHGLCELLDSRGFDTLLIIMDRLPDYILTEPTPSTVTAEDIARVVHRTWYWRFWLPRSIVADWNKLFTSKFWKNFTNYLTSRSSYQKHTTLRQIARPSDPTKQLLSHYATMLSAVRPIVLKGCRVPTNNRHRTSVAPRHQWCDIVFTASHYHQDAT